MSGLVADQLDVARIESGELPVSPEPAEVTALVDRARSAFSGGGSSNPLEIDIPPDLLPVLADRRRVARVLGNLLPNAARHSPPSSVTWVGAVREDVFMAVAVSDVGRGISPENLPRLFGKFSGDRFGARSWEQGADTPGWCWPSARGSWRPTGDASGPRATGRDGGPASPSPCPRRSRTSAVRRYKDAPRSRKGGNRRSG